MKHLTLDIHFIMEFEISLFTSFFFCYNSYSLVSLCMRKHTNTARGRRKRKTSPVHRLGLTHGREGVPKFIRENTEQFFGAISKEKSKLKSATRPLIATEQQQQQQEQKAGNKEERNIRLTTTITTPKPMITLPPIRTASSNRAKPITSASLCNHQTNLPLTVPSPSLSSRYSTPIIKSPTTPPPPAAHASKRPLRRDTPVDPDIFRKAYERALSVARSRLLFRDPYSLTRSSATHGILYSYYDHTPMCIFSRGATCNHRPDKQERLLKSNLARKKIFNDVIVERYMR
jgi:hypothetical protein